MDVESEISELKRRVGALEGAVSVLTGQLVKIHPDLMTHSAATSQRFDKVDEIVGKVVNRIDLLNTQLWSLRDDLPNLVAAALKRDGRDES